MAAGVGLRKWPQIFLFFIWQSDIIYINGQEMSIILQWINNNVVQIRYWRELNLKLNEEEYN